MRRVLRVPIAKEGVPFILGSYALLFTVLLLDQGPLAAPLFWASVLVTWFFRDPERKGDGLRNAIFAPADGKVVEVAKEVDFLGNPMQRLSIFMSIFDVHVNRAPVKGVVVEKRYFKGRFLSADLPKSSELNERNVVGIKTSGGEVIFVVQIAGVVARRIGSHVKIGDFLERGQRIGIIRFGSRVDLYLPLDWEITVQEGMRVKAGKTTVGYMP